MANLIDMTNSTLSQNAFCFETRTIDSEKISVPIEEARFGILNFAAITANETKDVLEFLFVIDCSGSMSDRCSDGRSKMQHIIHTLKNMLLFLHEKTTTKIFITINAFDSIIYNIIKRTNITEENFAEINAKIEKVQPRGSTNIQYALENSAEYIREIQTSYPEHIINHIFMTDGEATDGSRDISVLKDLVIDNLMNAFIGFGVDHDAALLNGIGTVGKSSYYFIDKLENAGLIYGEILHSIVYKVLEDAEIHITNGLIYDFKTNTWVEKLSIGNVISEANKTYNIITSEPSEFKAEIVGKFSEMIVMYPARQIEAVDENLLTKHQFRQRTLQLMYEANDYCKRKREIDWSYNVSVFIRHNHNLANQVDFDRLKEDKVTISKKLHDFMDEMKKYMAENNLNDDKFMKNLCDDIYICFRTFDTRFGNMYCTARQTSQGTQRQYTTSNTVDIDEEENYNPRFLRAPNLRRGVHIDRNLRQTNAAPSLDDYNDLEILPDPPIIMEHQLSDFADTPYLTPQATQVMRYVSSSVNYDDDLEEADSSSTREII